MLDIRLLGEQRLGVDGKNITADVPPRATALLAQLVVHATHEQARRTVAALFWPESSDEQALTNLRRELHQLRRHLPEFASGLSSSGRSLCWNPGPDTTSDVVQFVAAADQASQAIGEDVPAFVAAASEAVQCYGGDLLPAWSDEWVIGERERLHRRCLSLLDLLIDCERQAAEVGRALVHARRRIELEPLEEPCYRVVMQLQAEAGDRAAALRTFHLCTSLLERELGVGPDAQTVSLYESLVAKGSTRRRAASVTTPRTAARIPLVGRVADLDDLTRRWRAAQRGRSGLHLITGEAGVGKTRLLAELAAQVDRDGDVASRARCFAGGARLAMAPIAEWLGSRALSVHRDGLDRSWASEVERLVPSTATNRTPAPQPMIDAWQRHRFFQGLVEAVLVCRKPTLLTLDDIQWCDGETLTWLHLLLRQAHGRPLLVVATAREEEMQDNPELLGLVRALSAEGRLTRRAVEPLLPEDAVELALRAGGAVGDKAALFEATRGFPLFVIESARASVDEGESVTAALGGSPRVQAVLEGRLATLSEDAATVARLAAVVGRDFTPELLEEASDLPGDSVTSALDELWRRRLLVRHGRGTYDFGHDLLRDATLRQIPPPRLALLHRRVAQALELGAGDGVGPLAASIADHYEQADVGHRALPYHVAAAEFASSRFANDDAISHYQSAIRLLAGLPPGPERDRRELSLWQAMSAPVNARHGYSSPLLEEVLERAVLLAERLHDDRLELLSLVGLFSSRVVQGRIPESYEVSHRALVRSRGHPDVLGQAHFAVGGGATTLGRLAEALRHFELVPQLTMPHPPALVGTRPEVHSWAWESHALWLVGRAADAQERVDWAIARAKEVDHPYSLAVALAYAAMLASFESRRGDVAALAQETVSLCETYGFAYYGDWARILAGWAAGGRRGLHEVGEALTSLEEQGAFLRRPYYRYLAADVRVDLGDLAGAAEELQGAILAAEQRSDVWWLPEIQRRLAQLVPAAEARQLLESAAALASAQGCEALRRRIEDDRSVVTAT